jgi:hypothetical protein
VSCLAKCNVNPSLVCRVKTKQGVVPFLSWLFVSSRGMHSVRVFDVPGLGGSYGSVGYVKSD